MAGTAWLPEIDLWEVPDQEKPRNLASSQTVHNAGYGALLSPSPVALLPVEIGKPGMTVAADAKRTHLGTMKFLIETGRAPRGTELSRILEVSPDRARDLSTCRGGCWVRSLVLG